METLAWYWVIAFTVGTVIILTVLGITSVMLFKWAGFYLKTREVMRLAEKRDVESLLALMLTLAATKNKTSTMACIDCVNISGLIVDLICLLRKSKYSTKLKIASLGLKPELRTKGSEVSLPLQFMDYFDEVIPSDYPKDLLRLLPFAHLVLLSHQPTHVTYYKATRQGEWSCIHYYFPNYKTVVLYINDQL